MNLIPTPLLKKMYNMNIYTVLDNLNISYEEYHHQAIYTIEAAKKLQLNLLGIGCKNLLLTNHKNSYYLVIIEENKRVNTKELSKLLSTKHLSFASSADLKQILNLESGSLTPLSLINDQENKVTILLDKELQNNKILVHPNTNTKTLVLDFADLIKFINYTNHKYILI